MGLQIQIFDATTIGEIDAAFASLARERPDALFVGGDSFFNSRAVQFAILAAANKIPATYSQRDYVVAGGLDELRKRLRGDISSGRRLYRPHTQGREALRSAGVAIDQVRFFHQFANGTNARHRGAAGSAFHRR
jgi:hypothetical protein